MSDDERPLTAEERRALRELLESDRRAKWFWASTRVWATWIVAILAAITVSHDALRKLVQYLGR